MSGVYTSLEHEMCCPLCGDIFTHIDSVSMAARKTGEDGDITEITVHSNADIDEGNGRPVPLSGQVGEGRRSRIALHGWCESCNGAFAWLFTQHKGVTYVESVDLGEHVIMPEAS